MTITFQFQDEALDCFVALQNAGRACTFGRSVDGGYEITTRD